MRHLRLFTSLCWAAAFFPVVTLAQVPSPSAALLSEPETVTSEGVKDKEKFDHVVHDFVKSLAAPSQMSGKVAGWSPKIPFCPKTVGLSKSSSAFVTKRLRQVAQLVGAPLNAKDTCVANMVVVFTDHPQTLLDAIRVRVPTLLGFYNISQRERAARVSRPIQAWYATFTEDAGGNRSLDSAEAEGQSFRVYGDRLHDGLRSQLGAVTVVADTNKISGYQIGAIADYVALLALTQAPAIIQCKELPSIANLLTEACDAGARTNALSQNDIAYLKALYQTNPDNALVMQISGIAHDMEAVLSGH